MPDLIKKVKKTIASYQMLSPKDRVLIALSAGADSSALLDILSRLKDDYQLNLMIAHYNHKLRGKNAQRDEKRARELAEIYGLKIRVGYADDGWWFKEKGSLEECARRLRTKFLEDASLEFGATKIALGHNANDRVETFFINLLRGSGLAGLSAMPAFQGKIIRPLIELKRDEIREYLLERGIPWEEDETNIDRKFLRNRIRWELIPELESYNPKIVEILGRTLDILEEEDEYLERVAEEFASKIIFEKKGKLVVALEPLLDLPKAIARRAIRKAIAKVKGDLRALRFEHILKVEQLVESGMPSFNLDLPEEIKLKRSYDQLIISPSFFSKKEIETLEQYAWDLHNELSIELEGKGKLNLKADLTDAKYADFASKKKIRGSIFKLKEDTAFLDYEKLGEKILVRKARAGDRMKPFGMDGRKKLKKIFQELKVPLDERKIYPVLVFSEEILWVPGYTVSQNFCVCENTKKVAVLKLSYEPFCSF